MNINKNSNYIKKLEKKISSQTKKILELENYKILCEEYIRKLNPQQSFPITDEMINDNFNIINQSIINAEQKNYNDIIKKKVENELIKNGLLKSNINIEEVVELSKLKLENREYQNRLDKAQTMIDNLKNNLLELTKDNGTQIYNKLIFYKTNYEKINKDFEKLLNEKKMKNKENIKLKERLNNLYNEEKKSNIIEDIILNEINIFEKYHNLSNKYTQLKWNYNEIMNQYKKIKDEMDKIKKFFNKNDNDEIILVEKSSDLKNDNNDSFNFEKMELIVNKMDEKIKEKDKIIKKNLSQKEELENEVEEKLKYYDEYITNNKYNIKNILSKLMNLLIEFKDKDELLKHNKLYNAISGINKIIGQIEEINNIENYDIQLNDNLFFEIINSFLTLLFKGWNLISQNEIGKFSNEDKINCLVSDKDELTKNYNILKKNNYIINKENNKLKSKLFDLNQKLDEITFKFNYQEKINILNKDNIKNLSSMVTKFIQNIKNKDLKKVIYDILNENEQINLIKINKCIIEEKINRIENSKNNDSNNNDFDNELMKFISNEKNKLIFLINDYDNNIQEKSKNLDKLFDQYYNLIENEINY